MRAAKDAAHENEFGLRHGLRIGVLGSHKEGVRKIE